MFLPFHPGLAKTLLDWSGKEQWSLTGQQTSYVWTGFVLVNVIPVGQKQNLFKVCWTVALARHIRDRQGPVAHLTNVTFFVFLVLPAMCPDCPGVGLACWGRYLVCVCVCVSVCMCFIWLMGISGGAVCPCTRSVITAIKETRGNERQATGNKWHVVPAV